MVRIIENPQRGLRYSPFFRRSLSSRRVHCRSSFRSRGLSEYTPGAIFTSCLLLVVGIRPFFDAIPWLLPDPCHPMRRTTEPKWDSYRSEVSFLDLLAKLPPETRAEHHS